MSVKDNTIEHTPNFKFWELSYKQGKVSAETLRLLVKRSPDDWVGEITPEEYFLITGLQI